ncbi:MAG: hypothetical protein II332_00660 [Kiritimatiellae bacterium]|nr:hypothetical protein [Kiritimatiellia bacterium]
MKRIDKIIQTYGITKLELAKCLGVSSNYIYMLNSGAKPITDKVSAQLDNIIKNGLPHIESNDISDDKKTLQTILQRLDDMELDIKLIKRHLLLPPDE